MTRHPAGPFTVQITEYRIAPAVDVNDFAAIYQSRHRSPQAAARRLASIIAGRSPLAKQVRACISRDFAGRFLIVDGAGTRRALNPFRKTYS